MFRPFFLSGFLVFCLFIGGGAAHANLDAIERALDGGDTRTAVAHLNSRALRGDYRAMIMLSWFYMNGEGGVERDLDKATAFLEEAIPQLPEDDPLVKMGYDNLSYIQNVRTPNPAGMNQEELADLVDGVGAYDGGNFNAAEGKIRGKAMKGNATAQYMMGNLEYAKHNYDKARRWFEKSAKNGNKMAMSALSDIYEKGAGVGVDKVEALKWHILAGQNMITGVAKKDYDAHSAARIQAMGLSAADVRKASDRAKRWRGK